MMKLVQVFKSEMGERKPAMIGENELDLVLSEFKHSTDKSQTVIMTIKSMIFLGDVWPHRVLETGFYL